MGLAYEIYRNPLPSTWTRRDRASTAAVKSSFLPKAAADPRWLPPCTPLPAADYPSCRHNQPYTIPRWWVQLEVEVKIHAAENSSEAVENLVRVNSCNSWRLYWPRIPWGQHSRKQEVGDFFASSRLRGKACPQSATKTRSITEAFSMSRKILSSLRWIFGY